MGQLLGGMTSSSTPPAEDDVSALVDLRPTTIFECVVNGKVDTRRYQQYRKRSWEESEKLVVDLLYSGNMSSLFEDVEENQETAADERSLPADNAVPAPRAKKSRRAKQVVMYTNPHTGERHRLHPTMSNW